ALAVVVALCAAGSSHVAQAADTTLTLACQGMVTKMIFPETMEPEPVSMGFVVNFTNRTVQGTARWGPYLFDDQLQITDSTEMTVVFGGFSKFPSGRIVPTPRGRMTLLRGVYGKPCRRALSKTQCIQGSIFCNLSIPKSVDMCMTDTVCYVLKHRAEDA